MEELSRSPLTSQYMSITSAIRAMGENAELSGSTLRVTHIQFMYPHTEVLHGVLYPEAHVMDFKKNKKGQLSVLGPHYDRSNFKSPVSGPPAT